jgi:hypothetical protein
VIHPAGAELLVEELEPQLDALTDTRSEVERVALAVRGPNRSRRFM